MLFRKQRIIRFDPTIIKPLTISNRQNKIEGCNKKEAHKDQPFPAKSGLAKTTYKKNYKVPIQISIQSRVRAKASEESLKESKGG